MKHGTHPAAAIAARPRHAAAAIDAMFALTTSVADSSDLRGDAKTLETKLVSVMREYPHERASAPLEWHLTR